MRALAKHLVGLKLSGGDHDGERFRVLPWERRFVYGAFRGAGDAALSVARGNGKSALVAGIATAVVDPAGPLTGSRREVVCVASSFAQGRIIFEDVLHFLRADGHDLDNRRRWRVQDSQNVATCEHKPTGARVRCIGSDPKRAHGMRPALALADEPAQWDRAKSDRMLAAIRTGLGKVPGSKLIALGTRPAAETHWFSKMLAGGAAYSQCHAARATDPPFQLRTWRKANPSLDHLPSLLEEIRGEADDARRDPAMLAAFQSLRLNMGVADTSEAVLLHADVWESIEVVKPQCRGPYVLGVDAGTTAAMSAASAFFIETGALDCFAVFPERPSLEDRGTADGVGGLYVDMARRGELLRAGEYVSDLGFLLAESLRRWGRPKVIAADRWREGEVRQALTDARFPLADLRLRGMGFRDGSEDVRAFRRSCLAGHVRPGRSLLLRSAMSEARTVSDPAGNEKLSKGTEGQRRARAKDDAAAAAILAVAEGSRRGPAGFAAGRSWRYRGAA